MSRHDYPRHPDGRVRHARGWFVVSTSAELQAGEVRPLRYWGRELVLFRGASGEAVLLDAHCPHLGAHLGHGGRVVGDSLRCPFHGWRFDGAGACVEVPYAARIPARASTGRWPLRERNGVILAWHDPEGGEPDYEIPLLEECGQPGWTGWHMNRLEIATHPREIVENVADREHFIKVHRFEQVLAFDNAFEGHCATQTMRGLGPGGELRSRATYFGPGYQITWMGGAFEVRLINANTPVDENRLHLWFGVMIKFGQLTADQSRRVQAIMAQMGVTGFELDAHSVEMIHQGFVAASRAGYYEDVQIWERKLFREQPLLCDGDGPISQCRRWYGQFYRDRATAL